MSKLETDIIKISFKHQKETYEYNVELSREGEIWTAYIPALPICNAWGISKKEALNAIKKTAKNTIEILIKGKAGVPVEKNNKVS